MGISSHNDFIKGVMYERVVLARKHHRTPEQDARLEVLHGLVRKHKTVDPKTSPMGERFEELIMDLAMSLGDVGKVAQDA